MLCDEVDFPLKVGGCVVMMMKSVLWRGGLDVGFHRLGSRSTLHLS